jgi:biopolymer transport protein ExbD
MVDLAFLLITFFMLTTTLAKNRVSPVIMPDGNSDAPVTASSTMTVCLGKDNKVMWYLGEAAKPILAPQVAGYGANGIRKAILSTKNYVAKTSKRRFMIIIKPADSSVYDNLVSTLDEMDIAKVPTYAIADILPQDIDLLKKNGIY